MRRRFFTLSLVTFAASPVTAFADDIWDKYLHVISCIQVKPDATRLSCFDKSVPQLAAAQDALDKSDAAQTYAWSGNGSRTLPPFTMSAPWTLYWETSAQISIIIQRENGQPSPMNMVDTVDSNEAGPGSSYESATGTFSLAVSSFEGSWTVKAYPA